MGEDTSRPNQHEILVQKLKWLLFSRVLIISVLLGSTFFFDIKGYSALSPSLNPIYFLIGFVYLITLIYAIFYRFLIPKGRGARIFAYVQISIDIFFTVCLVFLTGGLESWFTFLFLLGILNSSVLLFRKGALFAAFFSSLLYFVMLIMLYRQVPLPYLSVDIYGQLIPTLNELLYKMFLTCSAFFLFAALSGYMTEKLRATGEMLAIKELDYRELEALNKNILKSITSGLLTTDLEGRINFMNRHAEKVLEAKLPDVYNMDIEEVFPGIKKAWGETILKGDGERFEQRITSFGGKKLWLGFSLSALKDNKGRTMGRIAAFQDLSEFKEMEAQVKRSDRLAALGKLSAGIAHEIRNPMASISGSIQLLKSELDLKYEYRRLMDIILRETDRLDRLVSDFLRFARPPQAKLEPIHLEEIIEESITAMVSGGQAAGVEIIKCFSMRKVTVNADRGQMKQVIWNLLLDAIQSMEGGGELRVSTQVVPKEGGGFEYVCTVADTGVGIDEENLPKIFDPFFTTKSAGTGLGLAVTYRIVESHGGVLRVESTPGMGTILQVILPLADMISPTGRFAKAPGPDRPLEEKIV